VIAVKNSNPPAIAKIISGRVPGFVGVEAGMGFVAAGGAAFAAIATGVAARGGFTGATGGGITGAGVGVGVDTATGGGITGAGVGVGVDTATGGGVLGALVWITSVEAVAKGSKKSID
jgi:hypothetical protein